MVPLKDTGLQTVKKICFVVLCVTLLYLIYSTAIESCNYKDVQYGSSKPILDTEVVDSGQLEYLMQDDPVLWKYIRTHHIVPPSTKEYNLVDPTKDQGQGQYQRALKLLKNMTGGFFVEVGAYNGESSSNTLTLERQYNWKGILIEGDPLIYPHLKMKHRKAWLSNACLSPLRTPQLVNFSHGDTFDIASRVGGPNPLGGERTTWTVFEVQCFPIYSILAAIDVKVVDYFSLDVEGLELKVLESIPFDQILIKVFSIEFHVMPPEEREALKRFMESKNYHFEGTTAIDYIYSHSSVFNK